nr:MAG TPA: hypothetical protein [Caudoviricetes sp.]
MQQKTTILLYIVVILNITICYTSYNCPTTFFDNLLSHFSVVKC